MADADHRRLRRRSSFPFSIFGGVINGFQRYDLNNMVGVGSSVVVAVVNVVMLVVGLRRWCALVMATTCCASSRYFIYRQNAYRVFPRAALRPSLFRWARVREAHRLQRLRRRSSTGRTN